MSLAALALAFLPALQSDPLIGLWEGRATGNSPMVPPEGIAFSLRLEPRGTDEVLATLTMEGVPSAAPAKASFDADNDELAFRCDLSGVLVDVALELDGDEFTGQATGLGVTVTLKGKRTSRDLPAPAAALARARVELTTLDAAAWRADLAFLAEELPRRHANAYHTLGEAGWKQRVAEIDARLATLDAAASAVALAQLVAAVGDAHTELGLGQAPFDRYYPLQITWLADGLFVTAADARFETLLGLRVVRVGTRSVEEALAAVRTVFAAENDAWPRVKAPPKLAQPALLHALGVTADARAIPFVAVDPGGEEVALVVDGPGVGQWRFAPDPALVPPPLWRRRTRESYWFEPVDEGHALYWAYNRCAEDPARPMGPFVDELLAALARPGVTRLVLDLRHNSGGNSAVLATQLPRLAAHPTLSAPGALRVLIGPATYSSGMMNALELRTEARARLYGEPTGGKPDAYGEVRSFVLPRSGLDVWHSTRLFDRAEGDPPAVEPNVRVELSSAEHFAGVDPVLERALDE
jgi:hypothetical protein